MRSRAEALATALRRSSTAWPGSTRPWVRRAARRRRARWRSPARRGRADRAPGRDLSPARAGGGRRPRLPGSPRVKRLAMFAASLPSPAESKRRSPRSSDPAIRVHPHRPLRPRPGRRAQGGDRLPDDPRVRPGRADRERLDRRWPGLAGDAQPQGQPAVPQAARRPQRHRHDRGHQPAALRLRPQRAASPPHKATARWMFRVRSNTPSRSSPRPSPGPSCRRSRRATSTMPTGIEGAAEGALLRVFDDGHATYFTFPPNAEYPAIFALEADRKEAAVNSASARRLCLSRPHGRRLRAPPRRPGYAGRQ